MTTKSTNQQEEKRQDGESKGGHLGGLLSGASEIRPINVRAKLFASDVPASSPFNIRASLSRNLPGLRSPLTYKGVRN